MIRVAVVDDQPCSCRRSPRSSTPSPTWRSSAPGPTGARRLRCARTAGRRRAAARHPDARPRRRRGPRASSWTPGPPRVVILDVQRRRAGARRARRGRARVPAEGRRADRRAGRRPRDCTKAAPSSTRRRHGLLDALRSGRASVGKATRTASRRPPEPSPLAGVLTPRGWCSRSWAGAARTPGLRGLFIAETTVKTRVGDLLLKLDARDRVALVVLAHSVGLVGAGRDVPLP